MQSALLHEWLNASLCASFLLAGSAVPEPVSVDFAEGSVHGFLALRSLDGKLLAPAAI